MGSDGEGAAAAPKATAAAKRAPASKAAKAGAPARGRGRGRGAAAGRGRGRGAAAKGGSAGSSGGVINLSDDDDDDGFGAGADTVSPHHLLPRRGPTHPCHPDVPSPRARLQEQAPPARSKRSSTARAATKRSRRGYQASPPLLPLSHPALSATRASLRSGACRREDSDDDLSDEDDAGYVQPPSPAASSKAKSFASKRRMR